MGGLGRMKYQSNVVIIRDVNIDKLEMRDYGMNREVITGNHKEEIGDDTTSDISTGGGLMRL